VKSSFKLPGPAHLGSNECNAASVPRVGVFYATREGQTRRIAEHIAADLRRCGFDVDTQDVREPLKFRLDNYDGVVVAASVHAGSHEREIVSFVKSNRSLLERLPSAFISVTLSEAGVEMPGKTAEEHARFVADVDKVLRRFYEETGWHPTHAKPVAGALLYTQYNFVVQLILKRIAKSAGGSTDTSCDHEYTNWVALDSFVADLAREISAAAGPTDAKMRCSASAG